MNQPCPIFLQSVINQVGIFAGEDGYDIEVGKNTDLKGAVIASKVDESKNKLSTDTITYSDIENKAEYSASNKGVNVNTNTDAEYNEKGITPNIGIKAQDDAKYTTKSAVAKGTIEVRSDKNKDLSGLSRDTENALNKLGQIFDKKKIEEKQELAKVFGEEAFKAVHQFSKHEKEKAEALYATALEKGVSKEELAKLQADIKAWDEGGANKIILHSAIGGIMADLGGGNALSGAVGAGVNESVQKKLKEKFKDNPDAWQWASAVIGTAAAKVAGGDGQTGASVAASGTKNNSEAELEMALSIQTTEAAKEAARKALLQEGIDPQDGLKNAILYGIEKGILPNPQKRNVIINLLMLT